MKLLRASLPFVLAAALSAVPLAQCELQTLTPPPSNPPGFGPRIAQDGNTFVIATEGSLLVYRQEGLTAFLDQEIPLGEFVPDVVRIHSIVMSGSFLAVAVDGAPSVIVYEDMAGEWRRADRFWPGLGELHFGREIALDGRRIAVLAHEDDGNGVPYPSVVFVYERDVFGWTRTARLESPLGAGEAFGAALDLDGDRLAVGVAGEARSRTPGHAYVFERTAAGWQRHDVVSALAAPAGFGLELDLFGDQLVIGGRSSTPGGLARVFEHDGTAWLETAELVTADVLESFSSVSVAVSDDDLVLAGLPSNDDRARDGGTVHVFERRAGAWHEVEKLHPSTPTLLQGFGQTVSCDGDLALVGSVNGGMVRTYSAREMACRTLSASSAEVSLTAGGRQTLRLNPGRAFAGRRFLLLGSATGFDPGFRLARWRVPLLRDWYFELSLPGQRSAPFVNNLGVLQASAPQASVTLDVPPGTSLALAGLKLYHAFVVLDHGVAHVSNVTTLTLVP